MRSPRRGSRSDAAALTDVLAQFSGRTLMPPLAETSRSMNFRKGTLSLHTFLSQLDVKALPLGGIATLFRTTVPDDHVARVAGQRHWYMWLICCRKTTGHPDSVWNGFRKRSKLAPVAPAGCIRSSHVKFTVTISSSKICRRTFGHFHCHALPLADFPCRHAQGPKAVDPHHRFRP